MWGGGGHGARSRRSSSEEAAIIMSGGAGHRVRRGYDGHRVRRRRPSGWRRRPSCAATHRPPCRYGYRGNQPAIRDHLHRLPAPLTARPSRLASRRSHPACPACPRRLSAQPARPASPAWISISRAKFSERPAAPGGPSRSCSAPAAYAAWHRANCYISSSPPSESASGPTIISSATLSVRLRMAASSRAASSGLSSR